MIDAIDRKTPRFPANKENAAKQAIRSSLEKEKQRYQSQITGIAGGASGGDILFHELCAEMAISSVVYLALPNEEYKKTSVSVAGKEWENRFDHLTANHAVHILQESSSADNTIWERTNLWMLEEALEGGGNNLTLIALWDGKKGDGNGGTEHMVQVAKKSGANTVVIDITGL